jgi:F-type H+-transporting ATPase subunit delta
MPDPDREIERYAEALLRLGEASGCLADLERQLPDARDLLARNAEVRRFLADPGVEAEGKRRAIERLLAGEPPHPALIPFLQILLAAGRLARLPAIVDAFLAGAAGLRQESLGELLSAVAVPDDRRAAIEREVSRILGKPVRLQPRVDPALLGGHQVRVGDFLLDFTVDHRLEQIRRGLLF